MKVIIFLSLSIFINHSFGNCQSQFEQCQAEFAELELVGGVLRDCYDQMELCDAEEKTVLDLDLILESEGMYLEDYVAFDTEEEL